MNAGGGGGGAGIRYIMEVEQLKKKDGNNSSCGLSVEVYIVSVLIDWVSMTTHVFLMGL